MASNPLVPLNHSSLLDRSPKQPFSSLHLALNNLPQLDPQLLPISNNPLFLNPDIPVPPVPSTPSIHTPRYPSRSRSRSSPKPKKSSHTSTYAQKVEILDWYHSHGKNQSRTALHFAAKYPHLAIKQPLVSAWVKAEQSIRAKARQSSPGVKRIRETAHPRVTALLEEWVQLSLLAAAQGADHPRLSDDLIRDTWREFATLCNIPPSNWLQLSPAWLNAFKSRNGLKKLPMPVSFSSPDQHFLLHSSLPEELSRLRAQTAPFEPRDLFDWDSMYFCYDLPPDKSLAEAAPKNWLTVLIATNADGSEKRPPLFIGTVPQARTCAVPNGGRYFFNTTGVVTGVVVQQALAEWNAELALAGRRIGLLVDHHLPTFLVSASCLSHITLLKRVQSRIQTTTIQAVLAEYRHRAIDRAIERARSPAPSQPARIFALDLSSAVRIWCAAWEALESETIANSWAELALARHQAESGSVGQTIEIDPSFKEPTLLRKLDSALYLLDHLSIVPRSQQLSPSELLALHQPPERPCTRPTTAEVVAKLERAEEVEMGQASGRYGLRDGDGIDVGPSCKEALAAVGTITRFVKTRQMRSSHGSSLVGSQSNGNGNVNLDPNGNGNGGNKSQKNCRTLKVKGGIGNLVEGLEELNLWIREEILSGCLIAGSGSSGSGLKREGDCQVGRGERLGRVDRLGRVEQLGRAEQLDQVLMDRDRVTIDQDRVPMDQDRSEQQGQGQTPIDQDQVPIDRDQVPMDQDQNPVDQDQKLVDQDQLAVEEAQLAIEQAQVPIHQDQVRLERDRVGMDQARVPVDREQVGMGRDQVVADQVGIVQDQVVVDRDQVPMDRDQAIMDQEQVAVDKGQVVVDRDQVGMDRDQVVADRDQVLMDRERAAVDKGQVVVDRDRDQVPMDQAQVPMDQDRVPVDRDEIPMDRDRVPVDRDEVPVNQNQVVVDQNQVQVDQDRDQAGVGRDEVGVDRGRVGMDREQVPMDGEEVLMDGDQVPMDRD